MSLVFLTAAALAAASPGPRDASAAPISTATGVTTYPGNFFANLQPTTALDMIRHLPGFTFDPGANVRGFGGAAGNVPVSYTHLTLPTIYSV